MAEEEQEQVNPEKILGVYNGERNNQDGFTPFDYIFRIFYSLQLFYLSIFLIYSTHKQRDMVMVKIASPMVIFIKDTMKKVFAKVKENIIGKHQLQCIRELTQTTRKRVTV